LGKGLETLPYDVGVAVAISVFGLQSEGEYPLC
jgi:hypothetical protein